MEILVNCSRGEQADCYSKVQNNTIAYWKDFNSRNSKFTEQKSKSWGEKKKKKIISVKNFCAQSTEIVQTLPYRKVQAADPVPWEVQCSSEKSWGRNCMGAEKEWFSAFHQTLKIPLSPSVSVNSSSLHALRQQTA